MRGFAWLLFLLSGVPAWTQTISNKSDFVQPVLELSSLNSSETPKPLLALSASLERSTIPDLLALAPVTTTPLAREQKVADKTVDKKFVLLFGMTAVLTVTDIELTQHCLRAKTCQEANFLYGSNPTRARMYGINVPLLSTQMMFSAWLKRRHPERNQWMIAPIVGSIAHGVGSISGATK
jgi:hypothetical protein